MSFNDRCALNQWSTLFLHDVCMLRECIYGECAHEQHVRRTPTLTLTLALGQFLSPVLPSGIRFRNSSEIKAGEKALSNSRWRHFFLRSISMDSALDMLMTMRYTNLRFIIIIIIILTLTHTITAYSVSGNVVCAYSSLQLDKSRVEKELTSISQTVNQWCDEYSNSRRFGGYLRYFLLTHPKRYRQSQ